MKTFSFLALRPGGEDEIRVLSRGPGHGSAGRHTQKQELLLTRQKIVVEGSSE
jgi:hypothetical protein